MENSITQKLYKGKYTITHKPNGRPRYKSNELGYDPNRLSPSAAAGIVDKSTPLMIWATRMMRDYILQNVTGQTITASEIEELVREATSKWRSAKQEAGDVGTFVHDWAEEFARAKMEGNEAPELPTRPDNIDKKKWKEEIEPQIISGIEGFVDWHNDNKVEFEALELLIYSEKYNYWGRFDAVAKVNGKRKLIDYKTSSGVYIDHWLQTSAYFNAYEEEHGKKLDGSLILHFQKDPEKAIEGGTFHIHEMSRKDHEKLYLPSFVYALNLARINKAMDSYQKMSMDELKLTPLK